jgi:uncharacterized protein YndB with AHSA1/START domain
MNDAATPIMPVRTSVNVSVSPARAYELFTRDMGTWWPLASHSVGLDRSLSVSFGPAVGDPIVETKIDGTTEVWGSVLKLDPPHGIAFNWHAGRSADAVTLVEVSFNLDADGATVVELVHSGWERWADGAAQAAGYQEGWPLVLGSYVEMADGDDT